jgi:hypothetical protein
VKQYKLEAKLVDASKNGPCDGVNIHLVAEAGRPAQMSMNKAMIPLSLNGEKAAEGTALKSTYNLRVQVTPVRANLVDVEWECTEMLSRDPGARGESAVPRSNCVRVKTRQELGKTARTALDRPMDQSDKARKWLEVTVKDFSYEGKPVGFLESNPNPPPEYIGRMPGGTVAVMPPPMPPAPPTCAANPCAPLPPPGVRPTDIGTVNLPDGSACCVVSRPASVPPPAPPVAMAAMPPRAAGGYCAAPVPAGPMAFASVIRSVSDKGKDRLEIHNDSFAQMTVDSLDLKVPGCDALKLSVDHQQVAMSCPLLRAVADTVATDHQGQLILQGHVRLTIHQEDHSVVDNIAVDQAVLRLDDGELRLKLKSGSGVPTSR